MIFPFWWKMDIKNIPTWFLKIDFISQSSFRFLVKLFPTLRMPGTRGAYSLPRRSLYRHVTNSSPIYTQVCSWWNTLLHHPLVQMRTLGIGNRLSASCLMPFCPFTDKVSNISNTDRWLLWQKRGTYSFSFDSDAKCPTFSYQTGRMASSEYLSLTPHCCPKAF